MAPLPKIMEHYSLTEMANESKPVSDFLTLLLFSDERLLHTENIVYKVRTKGRVAAPFVERGGEAVLSGGFSDIERNFSAPNIRIKAAFEAVDLLFSRRAGSNVFSTEEEQQQAIEDEVADHIASMQDEITHAKEWMCSQALQGTITFASNRAAWTVDMKKPAGNNLTAAVNWATVATAQVARDVLAVKKQMSDEVGLVPTHAICGLNAMNAIYQHLETSGSALAQVFDTRRAVTGEFDLTRQFEESGAIFIGRAFGIEWWGYPRQISVNGSLVDMVRPDYVEFVHAGPRAQNHTFYAAIPDLKAIRNGGALRRREFSKAWEEEDPSELYVLLHTRPFPVMKRPGSVVSLDTTP